MARPREFDANDLLETAMMAFWDKGLQPTSMRQIEAVTGVKQVSLYNAFGNKEGLFLAVLDRYTKRIGEVLDGHLKNRDLDGITAFVKSMVTPGSGFPNNSFGCLMVNTALVAEASGPAIKERVNGCRAMVRDKLAAALGRAKSRGVLKRGLNVDHCAELLVSTIWGIWVTIRLAADQAAGMPAAEGLKRTLRDWRVESS